MWTIDAKLARMDHNVITVTSVLTFFFFNNGTPDWSNGAWLLYGLWVLHYIHRAIIRPLTNPGGNKPIALVICFSSIVFNIINVYENGTGLSLNANHYESLVDPSLHSLWAHPRVYRLHHLTISQIAYL
jgi:hypothetical protein